ncbi:MAG: 4'-phosphopantetheinyl transferase superfamily protein [Chloroflexi bacterium]|nr:4'-phosphopantetheinyl transferase superfamily protein [Chloroflexota bacterium]
MGGAEFATVSWARRQPYVGLALDFGAEPIGIDIERLSGPEWHRVNRVSLSPAELALVDASPAAAAATSAALWTSKEAILKAARTGLGADPLALDLADSVLLPGAVVSAFGRRWRIETSWPDADAAMTVAFATG